mgnify:CR=1 FL=1
MNHHMRITVTPNILRYWWGQLNKQYFHSALPVPTFKVARMDYVGLYSNDPYGIVGAGTITVSLRVSTRGAMLATLAHEMLHQLQDLQGRPMVHGRFFNVVGRRISRKLGASIL